MQVKLSYTAEVEDVLDECAGLLATGGRRFQMAIELYNQLIRTLREEEFNEAAWMESLRNLRKSLALLDVRLGEVAEIVEGLGAYARGEVPVSEEESAPGAPDEEASEPEELSEETLVTGAPSRNVIVSERAEKGRMTSADLFPDD